MTNRHDFKYILDCIGSGDKMWCCEVCGGDVWRMYFQIELLKQVGKSKWTSHGCRNLLGHEGCLVTARKGGDIK